MNPLDIHVGPIIWTVINFFILLILLRILAWKPILAALERRKTAINEALDRADVAKAEAERILAENRATMHKAEEEAQRVLRESREYAERIRSEAGERAQDETRKMIEQAHLEIDRNRVQALNELRGEVATLAVGAAERILHENLDHDRQTRLVDDFLKQTSSKN